MDLLYEFSNKKINNRFRTESFCDLKLFNDGQKIIYTFNFNFFYYEPSKIKKSECAFNNTISIDIDSGNIETVHKITANGKNSSTNKTIKKLNNFFELLNLVQRSHLCGERFVGFWGLNYKKATKKIDKLIFEILKNHFTSDYYRKNSKDNIIRVPYLYCLLVDYHLDKNKIKGHDNVYHDISAHYPKNKWLKKNQNKFLPAVLDSYGIKTKYFISELSTSTQFVPPHISTLRYICKLFGNNYMDYIKQFNWKMVCSISQITHKRKYQLRTEAEKKQMVFLLKNYGWFESNEKDIILSIDDLLKTREKLEKYSNRDYKIKIRTLTDYEILHSNWISLCEYFKRKYKLKYNIPSEIKEFIERPINIDNKIFKPILLTREDDFKLEGAIMKNCMGKQFHLGIISLFCAMTHNKKRINLQYMKGKLHQSYGKANTEVPEVFKPAIEELTSRMLSYQNLHWQREKYDIIN